MNWKAKRGPADVERAVRDALPEGATADDVLRFAASSGLECSDLREGRITCSAPARSGKLLVSAKWLLTLSFDDRDRLTEIAVRKGRTGL